MDATIKTFNEELDTFINIWNDEQEKVKQRIGKQTPS